MKDPIFIEVNRNKIKRIALTYLSIGLVLFSLACFSATFFNSNSQKIIIGIGVVIFVLFAIVANSIFKSLRNKNAGIIIDSMGIHDNTTSISVKEIKWKHIKEFKVDSKENVVFVVINKPEEIIKNAGNSAIRKLLKRNLDLYKTPVVIETKYLSVNANQLFDKFVQQQKQFCR